MRNTPKGGSLDIPASPPCHWRDRVSNCVTLSNIHQNKGRLIFFIEVGSSDELHDASKEVSLLNMAKGSFIVFLQQDGCVIFDKQCTKRKRTEFSFEEFFGTFLKKHPQDPSVIVELSPVLHPGEVSTYFNALFGSHKKNKASLPGSVVVSNTVIVPKEFIICDMSQQLIDGQNIEHNSLEIGINSNSIVFKLRPSECDKKWSVTVVVTKKLETPSTCEKELIPHSSLVLNKLQKSFFQIDSDSYMQNIFEMMNMTNSHRSAFEKAPDVLRIWNSVVSRGKTVWYNACSPYARRDYDVGQRWGLND